MAVDLSNYTSIQTALFVRLDIPDYEILRFTDLDRALTVNGEVYSELGSLLGVTTTASELRASAQEVSITISGIPEGNVADVMSSGIKGSAVEIRRAFFNPATGALLPVDGNPALKFKGIVNNFGLTEDWDDATRTSTYSITIICTSITSTLENQTAGRRTNNDDQQKFFPGDVSMGRVVTISNSNYQFGAPRDATRAGGMKG